MNKLSTPIKIGLLFGTIGILLTIVGIIRGNVPANPASVAVALLIGGGVWFVVSWAVAAATVDVEEDVAAANLAANLAAEAELESGTHAHE